MATRCTCDANHPTFGACLRAKNLRIGYCRSATGGGDYSEQKRWDRELDDYRAARAQGIQPDGTRTHQIRRALDISDRTGKPYGGAD
jgi:hypothetical protein